MKTLFLTIILLFAKTPMDVIEFVSEDQTNTISYSEGFDCVQFSETLIENAKLDGFDAIPVMAGWYDNDKLVLHEFVAFNTSEGIMWIEPQTDQQYIVSKSGYSLCATDGECVTDKLAFFFYDGEFH